MSEFAYSYLRIDPRHVTATPWVQANDGVERDLPVHFETWEHAVDLHLLRRIRVDFENIARDLGFAPEALVLQVVVIVGVGGPRGDRRRSIWWRSTLDQTTKECSPEFVLNGGDLSQAVSCRTEIILQAPINSGSDLSPQSRGQRLWDDRRTVVLEPFAPRFRIEPASFAAEYPDAPGALWRLEWSPEDPTRDFTGSVRLLINSDNPAFIQAFSANDDLVTRLVMTEVISQITRGVLANAGFSSNAASNEPTSVGAAVVGWLDRAFPNQTIETVSELMMRDPGRFEATLAGLADA